MVEVSIDSIRVSLMSQHRIVILKDVDSERFLPIWIGPFEAEAITVSLQEMEVARPLTHDLLRNVIQSLGAEVLQIKITELRDDVFYARIVMRLDGRDLYFNSYPENTITSGPTNIPSAYRALDYDLPLIFRIGVSYRAQLMEDVSLATALDATHPNDNTEYVNTGVELGWRNIVFGRVGYKSLFLRDSEQGLTWGLGFQYGIIGVATIKIDYGFADYGRLKNIQYLSFGMRL